jgi:hypothetical protein
MKKVAICFSGAVRSIKYCNESIKKHIIDALKENYEVYLFGHFWILLNDEDKGEYKMKWIKDNPGDLKYIEEMGFTDKVIDVYNKEWQDKIIEGCKGPLILENLTDKNKNYASNTMGMWYKIYQANLLKQKYEQNNNMKFDYCIRMRPDFYWFESIPKTIFDGITDNDIVLQRDSYCIRAKWNSNDKWFAGTSTMMDKYCNMYNELYDIHNRGIWIEGQTLAKQKIIDMGLKIKFFGSDTTYLKCSGYIVGKILRKEIVLK